METARPEALFNRPLHPYTATLISAVPTPNIQRQGQRIILQGEIPSGANLPTGCRFRTRCPVAIPRCAEDVPALAEAEPGHYVACHLPGSVMLGPT